MAINTAKKDTRDLNRDPITGEPGSHPIGTSLGTAGGAVAGMAIGSALGPIGTVGGALIGTVVGGLAGAWAGGSIAEVIDPTAEDAYWNENYASRPYVEKGASYDTYRPAYQYGYQARAQHMDKSFEDVDSDLSGNWDQSRKDSSLSWDKARPAVRDAFDRTGEQYKKYSASGSTSTGGTNSGSASGSSNAGMSSNNAGLSGSGSYQSNLPGGAGTVSSKGDKI